MKDWIANLVNVTPAKGDRGRETEVRKREQKPKTKKKERKLSNWKT